MPFKNRGISLKDRKVRNKPRSDKSGIYMCVCVIFCKVKRNFICMIRNNFNVWNLWYRRRSKFKNFFLFIYQHVKNCKMYTLFFSSLRQDIKHSFPKCYFRWLTILFYWELLFSPSYNLIWFLQSFKMPDFSPRTSKTQKSGRI